MENHQKKVGPDYQRLKTMEKSIEQNLRVKNFEARKGNYETSAVVKNQGTKQREQRSPRDCRQWKANGQCSEGDNCSFRHGTNKRAKPTQPNPSRVLSCSRMSENHREPEVPEARVPVVKCLDCRARITSKELAPLHSVKSGIPPECLFYKSENGCRFGEKCSYAHRQVDEHFCKWSKKNGDKSAVAMLNVTRQKGCVSQDMEPPKSSSILRKSSNILKPIRCVKFTKAIARHADIRDQNPSLGMICPGDPHQRNPNAPKFENRSQEETEWQERCARETAWKLAKNSNQTRKNQTAFVSPSENWCLPAPSTLKPEEREFVVDSGASMHISSKKGFEFC